MSTPATDRKIMRSYRLMGLGQRQMVIDGDNGTVLGTVDRFDLFWSPLSFAHGTYAQLEPRATREQAVRAILFTWEA